jgi:hypothetical protein
MDLTHKSSWRSAELVKHRDNFTLSLHNVEQARYFHWLLILYLHRIIFMFLNRNIQLDLIWKSIPWICMIRDI